MNLTQVESKQQFVFIKYGDGRIMSNEFHISWRDITSEINIVIAITC